MSKTDGKMRVTLNINEDAEFRTTIRDMLKGAVAGLCRKELHLMMLTILSKEIKNINVSNYMVEAAVKKAATTAMKEVVEGMKERWETQMTAELKKLADSQSEKLIGRARELVEDFTVRAIHSNIETKLRENPFKITLIPSEEHTNGIKS